MNTLHISTSGRFSCRIAALAFTCALLPLTLSAAAQDNKKNPTSKMYVVDVAGDAQINNGESVQNLSKKSVYNAEGTTIEIKKPDNPTDETKVFITLVFSNGTGAYFGEDTRVEIKKFVQEPFAANRSDMDVEPSISQFHAFVARGTVGISSSIQVAGSNTTYSTPNSSASIRRGKVVVETNADLTKISILEGDSTVRAGAADLGGQTLRSGEQAIIRPGVGGAPNQIIMQRIPPAEVAQLADKVTMASMAKKTVYFEVREKKSDGSAPDPNGTTDSADGASGSVSAFDANSATSTSSVTVGEIVVLPTVPTTLPIRFTVSPATLVGSSPGP